MKQKFHGEKFEFHPVKPDKKQEAFYKPQIRNYAPNMIQKRK